MQEWHTYLTFEAPSLAEADPDKESVVDAVKAAVCECLILFMERNEEEFAKFLQASPARVCVCGGGRQHVPQQGLWPTKHEREELLGRMRSAEPSR